MTRHCRAVMTLPATPGKICGSGISILLVYDVCVVNDERRYFVITDYEERGNVLCLRREE